MGLRGSLLVGPDKEQGTDDRFDEVANPNLKEI
jgi:hypothetical protein